MAEEREAGEGDAVRKGRQVEENERSKWTNVPIMGPNDLALHALKTAVPMAIHAASASSDNATCQAPINSFKLAGNANCSELRGSPIEEHLDVFRQKPVRVSVKVNVPVAEHPKVSVFC